MPFQIVRDDITKMRVDAIVNAAKPSLLGGGGVDGAIHAAAGPELLEECRSLGGCRPGEAKITSAYRLPCRWVIHTVGPVWHGGLRGEKRQLASCYRNALELAREKGCESVAFPLISAGAYGYPKDKALRTAVESVSAFLLENDMTVYLVVYGRESLEIGRKLFADIQEYIDDHYVQAHPPQANRRRKFEEAPAESESFCVPGEDAICAPSAPRPPAAPSSPRPQALFQPGTPFGNMASLEERMGELDESFQQMLLRKIDERGMTDAQCYKKANLDRKLFSKIRKDVSYRPSKPTAIAFAIALELDLRETEELLRKAGFALSRSSKFDVIVQYFIEKRRYDIFEINEVLFHYDQNLLGA